MENTMSKRTVNNRLKKLGFDLELFFDCDVWKIKGTDANGTYFEQSTFKYGFADLSVDGWVKKVIHMYDRR